MLERLVAFLLLLALLAGFAAVTRGALPVDAPEAACPPAGCAKVSAAVVAPDERDEDKEDDGDGGRKRGKDEKDDKDGKGREKGKGRGRGR